MARPGAVLGFVAGGLVLAGALALLLWPEERRAQSGEAVATLASSFNDVRSRRARSLEWAAAAQGMPLFTQDAVRTLVESRAVISYTGGLVLNVDPQSLVVIAEPPPPGGVQEVQVAEGTVSGELLPGARAPSVVRIVGPGGVEARLVRKDLGQALRYRIKVGAGKTEVALLAGAASLVSSSGTVDVAAGQAVDVSSAGAEAPVTLPAFPDSLAPEVDAQVRIPSGPPEVLLRWTRPDRAARFRVQVGRSFSFDRVLVDTRVEGESYAFAPPALETYFWRVASIDESSRESEFGFARRFSVAELPQPGAEEAIAGESLALKVRPRGGRILRQAAGREETVVLRAETPLGSGDTLATERGGALSLGGAVLELAEGSRLRVLKAGAGASGSTAAALRLLEGEVAVQLKKGSELGEVALSAGAGVGTALAAGGARLRAELAGETARFVAESGSCTVRAAGASLLVPQGSAAEVQAGRPPQGPILLPGAPQIAGPDDGAAFYALDSPPRVELRWAASPGAARYRLTLARGDPWDVVAAEQTPRLLFAHNALKPGSYVWTVAALDESGRRGASSAPRVFLVEKDTTPPKVEASAPPRVAGAEVEVSGKTEPGAKVKVNGRAVNLGKGGWFSARVPVVPGSNQVVVEALDRAGNVTYKVLRVRRE